MNYKEICKILNISTKSFYNKYNGATEYTLSEILILLDYFNISFDTLLSKILKNERGNENERDKKNNH